MDTVPETFNAFLQQQEKTCAVARIEEYILPAIAAKNYVVNGSGVMKSRFTWHGTRIG